MLGIPVTMKELVFPAGDKGRSDFSFERDLEKRESLLSAQSLNGRENSKYSCIFCFEYYYYIIYIYLYILMR